MVLNPPRHAIDDSALEKSKYASNKGSPENKKCIKKELSWGNRSLQIIDGPFQEFRAN
jgi:hypothetical protein